MRVERCERWMVWRCRWLSVIGLVRLRGDEVRVERCEKWMVWRCRWLSVIELVRWRLSIGGE